MKVALCQVGGDVTDIPVEQPSETAVREALRAVLSSTTFADANRLKSFLEYIVLEAQCGRGGDIRAKLIAADVYHRRPQEGADHEAIVRVDAGRLRRRLDVYYSDEGVRDAVRISVPSGGYMPIFELRTGLDEPVDQDTAGSAAPKRIALAAALILVAGIGFALGWVTKTPPVAEAVAAVEFSDEDRTASIRMSVNQVSSASLLARTFVQEARALTFPSIDPARPRAAEILCRRAVEFAPELSLGHSCDAFVQAYFGFLLPPGDARGARLKAARNEADAALRIDPADAYAQMASAWTLFAAGHRDRAVMSGREAIKIAPDEAFLRNFFGMMMAFDGRGGELLVPGPEYKEGAIAEDLYHPFIVAGAKLQNKDYDGVIQSVEDAVALEGRTSALMSAIYVAALEENGANAQAETFARNLRQTWSVDDMRGPLGRFYTREADMLAIAVPMEAVLDRLE